MQPRTTARSLRVGRRCMADRHGLRSRHGLSLVEVVAASAILAMALAALGQQVFLGYKASVRSDLQAEAAIRCQTAVNTLRASNYKGLPIRLRSFADDRRWLWSASLSSVDRFPGLQQLEIRVHRSGDQASSEWSLVRLVRTEPLRSGSSSGGLQ